MTHRRVSEVLALAGEHHGLVTVPMLKGIGIDRSALWRLTDAGVLEPIGGRGIRRVAGGAPTSHQRLLASVWAAGDGAAASHLAAAWLWNLDPVSELVLDVSIPHTTGRRPSGVRLHHSSDLVAGVVTRVDGIPVTEPTRTLLDLASVVDADTLECAFDSAMRQGLTSVPRAEAVLRRFGRKGRNGTAGLRSLLDRRRVVDGVTDSTFEVRLVQVLRRAGLPEPVRQVELHDRWGFIGRFDCTYPEAMVAIEADSVRHHHARARFEADRERRARAEAIGWTVPTFTWRQVTRRPAWVASTVADILDHSAWNWRSAA